MNIKLTAKLDQGLHWMKENWLKNNWNASDHHYSKVWPPICNLLAGNISESDVNLLIDWTHLENNDWENWIGNFRISDKAGTAICGSEH